jgi:hypothetical protein
MNGIAAARHKKTAANLENGRGKTGNSIRSFIINLPHFITYSSHETRPVVEIIFNFIFVKGVEHRSFGMSNACRS